MDIQMELFDLMTDEQKQEIGKAASKKILDAIESIKIQCDTIDISDQVRCSIEWGFDESGPDQDVLSNEMTNLIVSKIKGLK